MKLRLTLLLISLWVGVQSLSAVEFYVAPGGKDSNPGTEKQPFQSWEAAQQRVRAYKATAPQEPITVYFKGGTYRLDRPVLLRAEDSGTQEAPIRYVAAPGETPVFAGSTVLKNWKPLTDKKVLDRLPEEVRGKVYVTDLKSAGVTQYGDPSNLGERPELFCNGTLQMLSRWPNRGMARMGRAQGETPVGPNWANFKGTKEGILEYRDHRQDRWQEETDARLGGYWFWDWSEEFQRIEKIDPQTHTFYLEQPYHKYGYREDSIRYFGLNILCELDTVGEWYLDRQIGKLYWYPSAPIASHPLVTLSTLEAPFMVATDGCSYLTLEGLSFEEGRGSAIEIQGGEECRIIGCRVERFGRDGIHITGGKNHTVSGALLRNLACSGFHVSGGDRKTLTPSGHRIEHCVVEHFSLFKRTYEPAVLFDGCGITISHNRFGHSSSSAMRLDGNDVLVEYNEVYDVVSESDDQGGIDTWYNPAFQGIVVRYNRWTDIVGGTHCGAAGVRLDDMICGVEIYGNIFERCGSHDFGGVQINGGKDNIVYNNLFYNCPSGVSFSPWTEQRWFDMLALPETQRRIYEEVDIRSEVYLSRYPKLKEIRENVNKNTVRNNLLVDCNNLLIHGNKNQVVYENYMIPSKGMSIEEVCHPRLLNSYGLSPIPVLEMGPKNNPWLEEK